MRDKRSGSTPSEQARRVEQAILALLLAEDHPWRMEELQVALGDPHGLVTICVARLHADGLLDYKDNGKTMRASRAAVRGDELAL